MGEKKEIKTENSKPQEEKKQEFLFSEGEYQKFENRRLEYSNALIGTFNEKGEYKITAEILKEFVAVPKAIREVRENRYYAIATSKNAKYNIKFSVVVGSVDDEKNYAILCVLEDVVSPSTGTYSLKSTPIATYRDDNDGFFSEKMKKAFNLKVVDEQVDGGLFDETKYPNYYAAKSKKLKHKSQFDRESEEIDQAYVVEMLKELKKMGTYGEWVINNIARQKSLLGGKFPQKGQKGYYKTYAILLDQAIINARKFPLSPEQKAIIDRIQQKRMDRVNSATTEDVFAPPKKSDKPKEKAAGDDSSGGGKKKSSAKKSGENKAASTSKAKAPQKRMRNFLPPSNNAAEKKDDGKPVQEEKNKSDLNAIKELIAETGEKAAEEKLTEHIGEVTEKSEQESISDSYEKLRLDKSAEAIVDKTKASLERTL